MFGLEKVIKRYLRINKDFNMSSLSDVESLTTRLAQRGYGTPGDIFEVLDDEYQLISKRRIIRNYLKENDVTELDLAAIGRASKEIVRAGHGDITLGDYMKILREEFSDLNSRFAATKA